MENNKLPGKGSTKFELILSDPWINPDHWINFDEWEAVSCVDKMREYTTLRNIITVNIEKAKLEVYYVIVVILDLVNLKII